MIAKTTIKGIEKRIGYRKNVCLEKNCQRDGYMMPKSKIKLQLSKLPPKMGAPMYIRVPSCDLTIDDGVAYNMLDDICTRCN